MQSGCDLDLNEHGLRIARKSIAAGLEAGRVAASSGVRGVRGRSACLKASYADRMRVNGV